MKTWLESRGANAHVLHVQAMPHYQGPGQVLFSYATPVAAVIGGNAYRTTAKHSKTTSAHVNAWLGQRDGAVMPQDWFDNLL